MAEILRPKGVLTDEAEAIAAGAGEAEATIWSRRDFFSLAGWAGIFASLGASVIAFTRFMFPRVLFEPPLAFNAGKPELYVPGTVDERWKLEKRVWIERQEDGGTFAIIAICTHLGCTPNWLPQENKFKCPCHGSGFKRNGMNFEGPAPRPLDRAYVSLDPNGDLVVDKSRVFRMAPGIDPDEQYPQSILKV